MRLFLLYLHGLCVDAKFTTYFMDKQFSEFERRLIMRIFKKAMKEYNICCDFGLNDRVRKFAERHAGVNTVVEVRAHGYLLKDNLRVTVTFKTNKQEIDIYRSFIEEFKNYNVKVNKRNLFIYKEIEP